MSYCFNPECQKPQNPDSNKFCQNCGSKLLLREHYRAIKPLGSGTLSRTFLAIDEDIPSKPACIIKQFLPPDTNLSEVQKIAERFEREALQLDILGKHPQIPRLLAYFQQQQRLKAGVVTALYLVQEFIEGQSLAQELEKQGPFNENQIRALLLDVLPVLQFIHSHQVIHRDIKPENIIRRAGNISALPGERGKFVLVDFSASKFIPQTAALRTATIIGSPEYIAPEQLEGKAVFASDLYSLGVTCVHLLTQLPPFNLRAHAHWVWQQYLPRPVSASLSRILDKMLQLSLKERYKSAAEILKDLTQETPTVWGCAQVLSGNSGRLRCVAINPDGEVVAAGGEDNTIKLWNLGIGNQPKTLGNLLTQHSGWVNAIAFSPDGQILVTGSSDRNIKIWDMGTGKLIRTLGSLFADWGWVNALAISANGQFLVSGHGDKTVKIWNLKTGKHLCTLAAHAAWVETVAISADGKLIVSGSGDKTMKIWQLKTDGRISGALVETINAHTDTVKALAISPDGKIIASGSSDNTVKLWQVNANTNLQEIYTLMHSDWVSALAFSPDKQLLASGSRDGNIILWNPYIGQALSTLQHKAPVNAVTFSANSQILASGGADGTVKIWRAS
ncbi:MAG: WD40 repeat domain-containing serine/threonine-protein kinase [Oscillatoriaceae bacterium SKW80]|nr:WD40 repeat domain-containing serine/threonine-protein kinase [Oscillatoriaceae bacterium SKYG93]MCX8122199.1 WD40 repeat domain-containing serine/threonine-protein kinase [Oscillatoriaceae bacterium SKW80]MDW8454485.1 WD40 repeat domain-containing serine/threonine-protein kinase [Oscillatoriaceae cyanobacterium SKYGB_i_bin93]HIK29346.1 protein kinase [Oscillatoriaceae cyanobacterium M7585_C2015_266]